MARPRRNTKRSSTSEASEADFIKHESMNIDEVSPAMSDQGSQTAEITKQNDLSIHNDTANSSISNSQSGDMTNSSISLQDASSQGSGAKRNHRQPNVPLQATTRRRAAMLEKKEEEAKRAINTTEKTSGPSEDIEYLQSSAESKKSVSKNLVHVDRLIVVISIPRLGQFLETLPKRRYSKNSQAGENSPNDNGIMPRRNASRTHRNFTAAHQQEDESSSSGESSDQEESLDPFTEGDLMDITSSNGIPPQTKQFKEVSRRGRPRKHNLPEPPADQTSRSSVASTNPSNQGSPDPSLTFASSSKSSRRTQMRPPSGVIKKEPSVEPSVTGFGTRRSTRKRSAQHTKEEIDQALHQGQVLDPQSSFLGSSNNLALPSVASSIVSPSNLVTASTEAEPVKKKRGRPPRHPKEDALLQAIDTPKFFNEEPAEDAGGKRKRPPKGNGGQRKRLRSEPASVPGRPTFATEQSASAPENWASTTTESTTRDGNGNVLVKLTRNSKLAVKATNKSDKPTARNGVVAGRHQPLYVSSDEFPSSDEGARKVPSVEIAPSGRHRGGEPQEALPGFNDVALSVAESDARSSMAPERSRSASSASMSSDAASVYLGTSKKLPPAKKRKRATKAQAFEHGDKKDMVTKPTPPNPVTPLESNTASGSETTAADNSHAGSGLKSSRSKPRTSKGLAVDSEANSLDDALPPKKRVRREELQIPGGTGTLPMDADYTANGEPDVAPHQSANVLSSTLGVHADTVMADTPISEVPENGGKELADAKAIIAKPAPKKRGRPPKASKIAAAQSLQQAETPTSASTPVTDPVDEVPEYIDVGRFDLAQLIKSARFLTDEKTWKARKQARHKMEKVIHAEKLTKKQAILRRDHLRKQIWPKLMKHVKAGSIALCEEQWNMLAEDEEAHMIGPACEQYRRLTSDLWEMEREKWIKPQDLLRSNERDNYLPAKMRIGRGEANGYLASEIQRLKEQAAEQIKNSIAHTLESAGDEVSLKYLIGAVSQDFKIPQKSVNEGQAVELSKDISAPLDFLTSAVRSTSSLPLTTSSTGPLFSQSSGLDLLASVLFGNADKEKKNPVEKNPVLIEVVTPLSENGNALLPGAIGPTKTKIATKSNPKPAQSVATRPLQAHLVPKPQLDVGKLSPGLLQHSSAGHKRSRSPVGSGLHTPPSSYLELQVYSQSPSLRKTLQNTSEEVLGSSKSNTPRGEEVTSSLLRAKVDASSADQFLPAIKQEPYSDVDKVKATDVLPEPSRHEGKVPPAIVASSSEGIRTEDVTEQDFEFFDNRADENVLRNAINTLNNPAMNAPPADVLMDEPNVLNSARVTSRGPKQSFSVSSLLRTSVATKPEPIYISSDDEDVQLRHTSNLQSILSLDKKATGQSITLQKPAPFDSPIPQSLDVPGGVYNFRDDLTEVSRGQSNDDVNSRALESGSSSRGQAFQRQKPGDYPISGPSLSHIHSGPALPSLYQGVAPPPPRLSMNIETSPQMGFVLSGPAPPPDTIPYSHLSPYQDLMRTQGSANQGQSPSYDRSYDPRPQQSYPIPGPPRYASAYARDFQARGYPQPFFPPPGGNAPSGTQRPTHEVPFSAALPAAPPRRRRRKSSQTRAELGAVSPASYAQIIYPEALMYVGPQHATQQNRAPYQVSEASRRASAPQYFYQPSARPPITHHTSEFQILPPPPPPRRSVPPLAAPRGDQRSPTQFHPQPLPTAGPSSPVENRIQLPHPGYRPPAAHQSLPADSARPQLQPPGVQAVSPSTSQAATTHEPARRPSEGASFLTAPPRDQVERRSSLPGEILPVPRVRPNLESNAGPGPFNHR